MIGKSILTSLLHFTRACPTQPATHQPGLCQLCRLPAEKALCIPCIKRFSTPRTRCRTCALPTPASVRHCGACLLRPPPLVHCTTAVDYEYPWNNLVQDFKFRQGLGWAQLFSELMFGHAAARQILDNTDLLVPIPSSPQRLRERGYDHLAELLRPSQKSLPSIVRLQRLHQDTPQHQSTRNQRLTLSRHSLIIPPDQLPVLRGRRLTLIDDVMTTGATLHATAQALMHAGAHEITAIVLARTPEQKHPENDHPHVQHRAGSS